MRIDTHIYSENNDDRVGFAPPITRLDCITSEQPHKVALEYQRIPAFAILYIHASLAGLINSVEGENVLESFHLGMPCLRTFHLRSIPMVNFGESFRLQP